VGTTLELLALSNPDVILGSRLKDSHSNIDQQGADWVPLVIVGNKSDMRPEQRQVTKDQGKALAEEFKCAWIETSARFDENVAKAFELVIVEIEKAQNPDESPQNGKCQVM
jgi:Ras family protein